MLYEVSENAPREKAVASTAEAGAEAALFCAEACCGRASPLTDVEIPLFVRCPWDRRAFASALSCVRTNWARLY